MSRKDRRASARPLKRRVATREPRKTLVVFCEGERTEPEYLDALKRQPSVRDVAAVDLRVETGQGGSVPRTLVTMATESRRRAIDEEAEIDEFWCVFDVEWPRNHPGLAEAVQQARANGIKLAVSNPCGDKGLDATKYMPLTADATCRAAELDGRHLRDGTVFPHDNPSSGMHRLLATVAPPISRSR
jgi:RloB-like protein